MRALFYHDPVPELGRPFLWKYFVQWSARMRQALPAAECRFLMADVMRGWAEAQGVPPAEILGMREEHLREASDVRAPNWNRYWYEGRFSGEDRERTGQFIQSRLGDFVPDLIFVHSPAPFLRATFPGATLLHYESGLLKFPPFPMSFYFDPEGFFSQSWLARNAEQLRSRTLSAEQQQQLDALRKLFVDDLLIAKSPFRQLMAAHAGRFPRRVLLPLQFGNFFGFDSNCPFHSQFEYARWVLERTPPDVGVVLTQHVYFEMLEDEALAFLKSRFPNLIHEPLFEDYNTASQFLLGEVDAVVTVTSSVGMQSLWWRKPLIAVGHSHLTAAADGDDPARVHEIIEAGWPPWKDAMLFWLLTRYYVPAAYVYSDSWLPGFLERMRSWNGDFELIDEGPAVLRTIAESFIEDIGKPEGNRCRAFELAAQQRLEALEALSAEADRRGRLIQELTSEADRRTQLIDEISAEAGRRLKLIEEISAEASKRVALIDELTAAVRDRDAFLAKWGLRRFFRPS